MLELAMNPLHRADELLQQLAPHRRSLAPGRLSPTSLCSLGAQLLPLVPLDRHLDWGERMLLVVQAVLRNFPENIFWDLDHLAREFARFAEEEPTSGSRTGHSRLEEASSQLAALCESFGRFSPLSFRYAHDLLYGYDWARWVARAPEERADEGPYSPAFLGFLLLHGQELHETIAKGNDPRYPPLPSGYPRNAFGYSRQPDDEVRLHAALARAGWLPIEAWSSEARPRWDRDYLGARAAAVANLGIPLAVA